MSTDSNTRILVAGIGNIFLGDDGFGVEVAQQLMQRNLPECVRVADFGIRGFDFAFALLDGYDFVIMVDAAPLGHEPGTLCTIEPDMTMIEGTPETHGMTPVKALELVKAMGGECGRMLLVACEPSAVPTDEWETGLSPVVQSTIPAAVRTVESLIEQILAGSPPGPSAEIGRDEVRTDQPEKGTVPS